MNDHAKEFFRQLVLTPSPSGFEEPVQRVVRHYAESFADEVATDVHGNVVAARNPDADVRVMLAGHCDQIGFIVNYIDADGFIYVLSLGGWDPQVLIGVRVKIYGKNGICDGVIGKKPIHLLTEDERKRVPKMQDLWIDIGVSSKEEAEKYVSVGDPVTVELQYVELFNHCVACPATDDKSGVWVVMEALRRIESSKLKVGVFAVSTVQEEVGLRGSKTSTFGIDPQIGIAVDVTFATDCPTIEKKLNGDIKVGGGPTIGKGPNMNLRMTDALVNIAEEFEIPYQMSAEGRITGTDAASIQVSRSGVAAGLISIPNRYMHTPVEIVSLDDMSNAADLIARYCESLSSDTSYIPQ
ncbi:MAG: M42 family metallopeptidase [Thermoguttaceae bacterium]|nr:M42 family metallopeptidase [Thermoguttaceae bacterium]